MCGSGCAPLFCPIAASFQMTEPRKLMSSVSQAFAGAEMSLRRKFNADCLWLICSKADLVLRRAGFCCVPQLSELSRRGKAVCTSFFALTLFFGKNSDRQGAVVHFQRSPSSGREGGTEWLSTIGSSP